MGGVLEVTAAGVTVDAVEVAVDAGVEPIRRDADEAAVVVGHLGVVVTVETAFCLRLCPRPRDDKCDQKGDRQKSEDTVRTRYDQ
jgi:hypothetical protein